MTQPTTERLALAMEEAGCPAEAIALARAGHYDLIASPMKLPIQKLADDLREMGFSELAERAITGEFNPTPDEAKAFLDSDLPDLLTDEGASPPTARSALLDHIWRSHGGV